MTILVLFALAYRMTGETAHEWTGIAVFVLFAIHTGLNRKWYKCVFNGEYHWRRALNTVVNLLLCLTMAALMTSGLLLSSVAFPVSPPGGMFARQLHAVAAYWGFILIAIHAGMHWGMIINVMGKTRDGFGTSRIRTTVLRVLAALVFACGIAASFDRGIGAKLFLGFSFDYWDTNRPAILFFSANLAIMGLYIGATHCIMKFTRAKTGQPATPRH
ncbi:MAG: DUF4405 domain-containing protein [Opitutaceae bacterium]|nr:DUF4405 domain-containing protein [Opitutaceae bacterium]